ncbi:MAG: hypothetical protein ACYTEQ_30010 [Planctomycetota bacterium]
MLNEHGAEWKKAPAIHAHIGKYVCKLPEGRFYTNDPGGKDGSAVEGGDEAAEGTGGLAETDQQGPDVAKVAKPPQSPQDREFLAGNCHAYKEVLEEPDRIIKEYLKDE